MKPNRYTWPWPGVEMLCIGGKACLLLPISAAAVRLLFTTTSLDYVSFGRLLVLILIVDFVICFFLGRGEWTEAL